MMELPAPLQRHLDRLEDALLEGRAITEGVEFDAITGFFEDEHLDGLPQVLAHGFVAALPTAFGALFHDQRLIEALALAPSEALDAALRLQFMTACVAEVLLAEPGDTLVAGHLRCGLLALRAATARARYARSSELSVAPPRCRSINWRARSKSMGASLVCPQSKRRVTIANTA